MKKQYTKAELEVLSFENEDVIVTSGGNNETPKMPWNSGGIDPYTTVKS